MAVAKRPQIRAEPACGIDQLATALAELGHPATAIPLVANGARRNADVIVATLYRRYYKFKGTLDQQYDERICFWDSAGTQIANYPEQHRDNCVTKRQNTARWFKPMVRVLKNMRGNMVDSKQLDAGVAHSYY